MTCRGNRCAVEGCAAGRCACERVGAGLRESRPRNREQDGGLQVASKFRNQKPAKYSSPEAQSMKQKLHEEARGDEQSIDIKIRREGVRGTKV